VHDVSGRNEFGIRDANDSSGIFGNFLNVFMVSVIRLWIFKSRLILVSLPFMFISVK
jgi:hypothetical protein